MPSQLKKEDEIKIFILYLLDKIGYPLDYPSIGSIMMQDGIVNFFDFAQCFFSLVDAGHIREIIADKNEKTEGDENVEIDDAAVDAEIERMKRLSSMGGFIPCPDHRLMPGTKFELVQYYAEEIKKIKI